MKKIKPYLRIIIALIMLFLLYRSGLLQFSKITSALSQPLIIVSGFFIFCFQFLAFSLRWKLMASLLKKIPLITSVKLHLIGQFFNTFIPGGVGGDVVKAIEFSNITHTPKTESIALTLVDRVLGLYCLILFSFLFLLIDLKNLSPQTQKYLFISGILFFISTLCLILRLKIFNLFSALTKNIENKFLHKFKETLTSFFISLNSIVKSRKLVFFVLFSFMAQLLSIVFLYIVVCRLSLQTSTLENPTFYLFFPLACFGFMTMAIPITPGGIGFGQAAFYFIFKSFSTGTAEAAIVGISLLQLFYIVLSLPGGYYFIRNNKGIL